MQLRILHSTFRHKRIELTKQTEILQIFQKAYESHTDLQSYPEEGQWVPVTTAWRVLGLRMEERPPVLRVAANILN
jgi:NDP-sugar pyrophosphorylase family protein